MKSVQELQQPNSMDSSDSGGTTASSCEYAYRPLTTKHRRAGSTGTTGDEEYTTDEDELYGDETDCTNNVTQHPMILKSDLARAATDLFGYDDVKRTNDDINEPTSLFDEDDEEARYCPQSTQKGPITIFTYNEGLPPRLGRRRSSGSNSSLEKSKSRLKTEDNHPLAVNLTNTFDQRLQDEKLSDATTTTLCNGLEESDDRKSVTKIDVTAENSENGPAMTVTKTTTTTTTTSSEDTVTSSKNDEENTLEERNDPPSPSAVQWGRAVAEVKEQAISKLQEELRRAHEELKLKDEEVARLSRIRQDVEAELEELTASLFQEAHNMVREANQRQANAERLLEESRMKCEVLAAEVAALKTLVLTSTPAQPNPHLHPQIANDEHHQSQSSGGIFAKRHRRSPSHFNLKYGRENSPPDSPQREQRISLPCDAAIGSKDLNNFDRDLDRDREREKDKKREKEREKESRELGLEVDPRVHNEFLLWKANPCVDKSDPFVERIFHEDIDLCLDFPNVELGARVRQAVLDGIIFVEAVSDKAKLGFPKKCALLEAPRQCHYRMRISDQENQWYSISQICRNRIIAVCDFLNYLRYIERGLVKSSVHDVYWEITRLRKEMVLARLGLALSSG